MSFYTRAIYALTIVYSFVWVLLSVRWIHTSKQNTLENIPFVIPSGRELSIKQVFLSSPVPVLSNFTGVKRINGSFLPSFSTGTEAVISIEKIPHYNEFVYENFRVVEPFFPRPVDKKLFYEFRDGTDLLAYAPYNKQRGVVEIIPNGFYPSSYLCGWPSDYKSMHAKSEGTKHFPKICPLLTPEANSFQHFIDGLLPKLVQVRDILLHPDMQLLMQAPRSSDKDVILGIIERVGINMSQIVWADKGISYSADVMVAACITPPIHPVLWKTARKLIGVQEELPPLQDETLIVLLTRAKSHNGGRNLLNKEEVVAHLNSRYGKHRVVVFKGGYSMNETLDLFGKTSLMIGVHGGALYNLNFAPRTTRILEIMPHSPTGYLKGLATTIFWAMAGLIGQPYWRLFVETNGGPNNVILDVGILNHTLNKIDSFMVYN